MNGAERFSRLTSATDSSGTLKTRSVRGGFFNFAAEGADFILRVGSIAVLARLLLPEHFGLIGMVTAITVIAERFKDLGLSVVTVQREHITHEQVSLLFWVNAALGLVTGLLVAALAVPIAAFYDDERLVHITLAIALTFVWSGLTIQHLALLRRTMKFGRIATVHIGSSAISIVVAIILAANDFGYWALVAREVVRSVLLAIGTWAFCPWIPGPPARLAGAASMLSFGGSLTAVQLATHFTMSFGHILIGRFFGAHQLGMYRQGIQLVLVPIDQLLYPIYTVSEVALSRLQSDAEKYRRYYQKVVMLLCMATMPLSAFIFVQAENIVLIMLGADWMEAVPFFRILALAAFMSPPNATIGIVMVTCGHSRKYLVLGLVSSAALVVFCIIGISWGALGIAAAHISATYGLLLPRLYWGLRDTPVRMATFFAAIARPAAASLTMAAVLHLIDQAALVEGALSSLLLAGVAGAAVYATVWIAVPGGWSELRDLVVSFTESLGIGGRLRRQTP